MSETTLIHDPSTNVPDYAAEESARLEREFADIDRAVTDLLAEARGLPPSVDDEEIASAYTAVINRFKDVDDRVEALRAGEKQPWMRRADAVDSFFFRLRERLFRRKKTDKVGGGDVLKERLHAYNQRREAEERRKREEAERTAREAEEKARLVRQRLEREQREAEERAARARKESNKEAAEKAAREAEAAAAAMRQQEDAAREQRQDAQAAAQAKPGDLVRERHGSALNTMKQVWHVEVVDSMKLDSGALWPFVTDEAKEKAAKAWAKTTNYKKSMDGLLIEQRSETVVRR